MGGMLRTLVRLRGPVLLVHILVTVISASLIGPLTASAICLAIGLSGKPALTDMEIARFFLTPTGLLCLVFAASLLIVLASLELAALLWLLAGGGGKGAVFASLQKVAALLPRLLWVAAQLVVRLLVLLAPFALLIAAIAWFFLREHDINFYLTARPPEFWLAVVLSLPVLSLAFWVLLRQLSGWVFVLPVVMFTQTPLMNTFAESKRLAAGRRWQIGRTLMLWAAISIGLGALATLAFRLLVEIALPDLDIEIEHFVVLGAILLVVWSAMLLVTGAASAGLLAGFVSRLAVAAGIKPSSRRGCSSGWRGSRFLAGG